MTKHLMIIDDDQIFRLLTVIMSKNLAVSSLELHEFEDGELGINGVEKLSNTKEKVIILLDINMPVLDGWGFLDQLKENKYFNIENIELYIVSSSIDESDILKANSYEIVKKFIHKPIDQNTIRTIVNGTA
ncbi:response regulator [Polaribacter litorisediminis]|uniref:response regulator n=1 Tax=Polaribacter litorisediminis TaxID=1908341 RepID=UPI001CBE754A|nr:response regulator [Polaribacter litorisediminis]UAM97522.1 response regulator [Polaribacter litorisediminis]